MSSCNNIPRVWVGCRMLSDIVRRGISLPRIASVTEPSVSHSFATDRFRPDRSVFVSTFVHRMYDSGSILRADFETCCVTTRFGRYRVVCQLEAGCGGAERISADDNARSGFKLAVIQMIVTGYGLASGVRCKSAVGGSASMGGVTR
jgi:hypothetical protein